MKSYFRTRNCDYSLDEQRENCREYIGHLEEAYLNALGHTDEAEAKLVTMANAVFVHTESERVRLRAVREEDERRHRESVAYDQQQADALAARRG